MGKHIMYNPLTDEVEVIISDIEESVDLESYKIAKIDELNASCEAKIITPFKSSLIISSTGQSHTYYVDRDDQRNFSVKYSRLIGDSSIVHQPWKTKDYGIVLHTRLEFIALVDEMMDYIENLLFSNILKKQQVEDATTREQIDAIV